MTEAIDILTTHEAENAGGIRFSYSRPEQRWLRRTIIRGIEKISGQPHLERLYRAWIANPRPGENIFAAAIRLLDIDVATCDKAWSRVPKSGPVLFVANHPFGVIDGLLMGHLATSVRPDTKIMTHSLLCEVPEAREYLLPVDFGGTPDAIHTSALTRKRCAEWLRQDHAVAIFPAGSVSTSQSPIRGPALDAAWHPFAAKLALLPGTTIVPVFFHGQNSRLFQAASHVNYSLRVALLFRESRRRAGSRIAVSVGEPVTAEELSRLGSRDAVIRDLRRRTLTLSGPAAPCPDLEFRWPAHIAFN